MGFFLKFILWIPPLNPLNSYRLAVWWMIANPAIREYNMFLQARLAWHFQHLKVSVSCTNLFHRIERNKRTSAPIVMKLSWEPRRDPMNLTWLRSPDRSSSWCIPFHEQSRFFRGLVMQHCCLNVQSHHTMIEPTCGDSFWNLILACCSGPAKLGAFCWLGICLAIMEFLVCVKFGRGNVLSNTLVLFFSNQ